MAEGTAGGRVDGAGDVSGEADALFGGGGIGLGDGGDEGLGVGVAGGAVEFFGGAHFDDLAEIHDGEAVADVFDDGEVVGNEEVGEFHFLLEVHEEIEDLALDGDVEGGDGFVADDEFGLEGDGAGDADALALAAAELERELAGGGGGQADFLQEGGDPLAALVGRAHFLDDESFADDVADGLAGVEGLGGVLEDHLEITRALTAVVVLGLAFKHDGPGGGLEQMDDGLAQRGLAAAGFADDAERLSALQGEGDAVHGLAGADGAEKNTAAHGEVDVEIGDV